MKAHFLPITWHSINVVICFFFIWGWLTVSDLRETAKERHLDWEQLVDVLMTTNVDFRRDWPITKSPDDIPLGRHALRSTLMTKSENATKDGTSSTVGFFEINWLALILRLADLTLAFFTCLSVGYITGLGKILLALRGGRSMKLKHLYLKPLICSTGACLFFLLALWGGSLLWESTGNFRMLSLPTIGIVGAIQIRKVYAILENVKISVPLSKET